MSILQNISSRNYFHALSPQICACAMARPWLQEKLFWHCTTVDLSLLLVSCTSYLTSSTYMLDSKIVKLDIYSDNIASNSYKTEHLSFHVNGYSQDFIG